MEWKVNGVVCRTLEEIRRTASPGFAAFVEEWTDGKPYVVAHTSGSTGVPKEIRLQKEDMRQSALLTIRRFGLNARSRFLLCLSPSYIAGKMMIVRAMEAGGEIVEEKPSNRPLAGYEGNPFDLVAVVPSQALWLVENPERLERVRTMIVGGGAVSESLRKSLVGLGVDAYSTYGMTETCSHVALARIAEPEEPYRALPPVSFSQDSRGCLVVHVPHFSVKELVTNDVVELLSADSFYWRGRFDNVINTGGVKVFPEEVERLVSPWVNGRFYVSSRPSEKWGMEVVLVVEGEMANEEKSALLQRLKSVLPPYSVPKSILSVSRFKETASGKIIREKIG